MDILTSFHLDHGNGLDPYRVGATLGLGAPSLMVGKNQVLPYCYKDYKILDNGPLRFTVELTYNPSTVGDMKNVVEHRIISLDKGSNLNKMTVWYDGLTHATDFATGFPIHEEDTESKTFAKDYVSYADPTDNIEVNNSQVFVGVSSQRASTTLLPALRQEARWCHRACPGLEARLEEWRKIQLLLRCSMEQI